MRSFERGYVFELCLILKYLFTKHLHMKDPKYFRYIEMFIDDTSNTIDLIELPEILGNWKFWIIWNLCERILIFSIFI